MSIRNDDATKKTWVRGINKRSSHVARKKRTTGKHLAIKGKLEGTEKKGRSDAKTFPHGRCALVHSKIPSNTPPQCAARLNASAKCLTFVEGRAFVSASATISSVGQ